MPPPGEPPTPPPGASPVQTTEPTAAVPIPPPPTVVPTPRRLPALDLALAAVVLGLAFLVASAPARNSDLWLHLAAGRDLLAGKYHLGSDPYAQDTGGAYWANASWLYDVLTYLVFQAAGGVDGWGGAALVLLKALTVTGLAAVLLRLGWCGRGLWAPAVGAAWAVLVLSPWLAPHPMIVSYLFLGLTLFFLERPHRPADESGANRTKAVSITAYWPLWPLCALWANLDSWFLLGPLTVALYLLGQALQARLGRNRAEAGWVRPGETKALAVALAASLAACLLNPHHVYVFLTPPAQLGLSPAAGVLQDDAAFQALRLSPFQSAYLHSGAGWNAAAAAYFPLVLFSGLSFLFNFPALRWRRLLVWAALFLLSAFQVRAIPFFAVAAGPMLALNVQGIVARRIAAPGAAASRRTAVGRVASLLAALALLVVGWTGRLHAPPFAPPRWRVEADPGLRGAAEQVARWRAAGALGPDDRGFNLSTDAADAFAWFCPDEKGVVDARHPLFPATTAADFVTVRTQLARWEEPATRREAEDEFIRETLAPQDGADPARFGGPPMEKVREVLRRRGVDHLIVYDNDRQTVFTWMRRLQQYPGEWPLLYLGGRAAVFGWCDPEAAGKRDFAALELRPDRLAFHPPDDARAPDAGPGEATPPGWAEPFLRGQPPPSPHADEAAQHLLHFDQEAFPVPGLGVSRHGFRTLSAWQRSLAVAAVGAAGGTGSVVAPYPMTLPLHVLTAGPSGPVERPQDYKPTPVEQLAFQVRQDHRARHDDGPTALLYLALRAARRAVRDDPDDARAYLALGETYQRFLENTAERVWYPPRRFWGVPFDKVPLAYRVRTAEAVAAYENALRLNPDLEEAHLSLISLYQDLNYQDKVLEHMRELVRCARQAGRRPDEDREKFARRVGDLEAMVEAKDKEVKDRREKFEVESAGRPVAQRAKLAFEKFGLAGEALSLLLKAGVEDFGAEGYVLEVGLLLQTGRPADVRAWVKPDSPDLIGSAAYLEIEAQLEAASGNYKEADADLAKLADWLRASAPVVGECRSARGAVALGAMQLLLETQPQDGGQAFVARSSLFFPAVFAHTQTMADVLVREADVTALRGSLALESGDVDRARDFFRAALAAWGDDDRAVTGAGLDFSSRRLAQAGLADLDKDDR